MPRTKKTKSKPTRITNKVMEDFAEEKISRAHFSLDKSKIKSQYAWVLLVMKGDSYVPGALVMAHSLRRVQTAHDIVCMVSDDVSDRARQQLNLVCNVVSVPYLKFRSKPMKTAKQQEKYSNWMNASYTKWNCLNLTQYKKVIFLDVDKIVIKNIDHLFSLQYPAGTFSNPWAYPFAKGKKALHNPYMNKGRLPQHGSRISKQQVIKGLSRSHVLVATTVLLRPDAQHYKDYIAFVKSKQPYKHVNCFSMVDEQSIAEFMLQKYPNWYHIHRKHNFIPWKFNWLLNEQPTVMHFFNINPWNMERKNYPDLEYWWILAKKFLQEHYNHAELLTGVFNDEIKKKPTLECFWCKEKKLPFRHLVTECSELHKD